MPNIKKLQVITQHEILVTDDEGHCAFECCWLRSGARGHFCDLFGEMLSPDQSVNPKRYEQCVDCEEL